MNNSRYLSRNTKKIPLFQLLRLRICCLLNDNENIMFLKASILQLSATGHCTAFVECTCSFCGVSNWLFILDFTHSVQFLTPQTDWQLRGNSFCLDFRCVLFVRLSVVTCVTFVAAVLCGCQRVTTPTLPSHCVLTNGGRGPLLTSTLISRIVSTSWHEPRRGLFKVFLPTLHRPVHQTQ